jgi:transposase
MTLNPKIQVQVPAHGVVVRRSGNRPTVYKVLRYYRNEKGQPTNERVDIGKLDPTTGKLIPNAKYWEYYGGTQAELEVLPAYESILSIGCSFLIEHIMNSLGLLETLTECLGRERASQVKTAAIYMAARGNVFEGVLDYCEGFTLLERPLSSPSASDLFRSISHDERMAFFKKWAAKQQPLNYLAYDVTSFSSYAKDIVDSERGYNRDGEKLPRINLGCFLSENTSLPVFYVRYPGSIIDKSHPQYMMAYNKELGISDVVFVLDRGFRATKNIEYLTKERYKFIIGVEKRCKTTSAAIDIARDSIVSMNNYVGDGVYGVSMEGCFYGTKGTMSVYFSAILAERQREDLYRSVESMEETLNQLKQGSEREIKKYKKYFSIYLGKGGKPIYKRDYNRINEMAKNSGYFCLFTNTDIDTGELLSRYRHKDVIEKAFDDIKNHIDMKRLRTHHSETTDGKLFCSFISLAVITEMMTKLRPLMKKKGWSKDSVIRELEKIRIVTLTSGKTLMNPLTKAQRNIFHAFGIGDEKLKEYIAKDI